MKVSHVLYLSEKPGQNPFSGAENHVLTLLGGLVDGGADVELIVLLWNPGPTITARLAELRGKGVKVTTIARDVRNTWKGRLWRAIECWAALYRLLKQRRDRVLHVHLDLIATPALAALARCKRVVLSIHNDEPCYATRRWRIWLRTIDRWISAYIGITDHVRAYYSRQARLSPQKIRTIYYGVPTPPRMPIARADFGIPSDRFVIGFVGRLTRQKNVELLLDAIAELPQVYAVIVGDGELRAPLEEIAATRRLTNVRFLGALPDAARLMPLFDVFCLPSRWEGLGLVLIEAMLQRVPIVASNAGAIPEILRNGELGIIFEANDRRALVEALRRAMCGETVLGALADKAYDHAKSEFLVERMAARTLEVYNAL